MPCRLFEHRGLCQYSSVMAREPTLVARERQPSDRDVRFRLRRIDRRPSRDRPVARRRSRLRRRHRPLPVRAPTTRRGTRLRPRDHEVPARRARREADRRGVQQRRRGRAGGSAEFGGGAGDRRHRAGRPLADRGDPLGPSRRDRHRRHRRVRRVSARRRRNRRRRRAHVRGVSGLRGVRRARRHRQRPGPRAGRAACSRRCAPPTSTRCCSAARTTRTSLVRSAT